MVGRRTLAVFILSSILCSAGCMSYTPENITAVTDENYQQLVYENTKPSIVYFHKGLSSSSAKAMLPHYDKLAGVFGDDVEFLHCDIGPCEVFIRKANLKYTNTAMLFKDGKKLKRTISINSESELALGAILASVSHLINPPPDKKFTVPELQANEFDAKVLGAEKPVVLSFARIKKGRGEMRFVRHFQEAASKNCELADFYEVSDASIVKLCGTPKKTVLVVYDGGSQISFHNDNIYKEADANEWLILSHLAAAYLKPPSE